MDRERFLGIWNLIRLESRTAAGDIEFPWGEKPIGRLTYDRAGRMSAQLMRPDRRSSLAPGQSFETSSTVAELLETVLGFAAYCGTYDVDESSHTVIHHIQVAMMPSWVGMDLTRSYRFDGERLILSATLPRHVDLTWKKEPD